MVTSYTQLLHLALPEVIVVLTSILVIAVDLAMRTRPTKLRFGIAAAIAATGCAAAIVDLILAPQRANVLNGAFLASPLTQLLQIALLTLTIFTLLLSADSDFTTHIGEFVLLILLATVGMMFLVATQDLLVIFISLELLSLSLYILTAFDKRSARSSEAALKYFLFGGMSAAFLLFGFSLLYGLSNSTNIYEIAFSIRGLSPLLIIAMIMTMVGFGFKIAAVPFHFWAPDVYEAAPAPAAAFIASSSKVASFFVFFSLMSISFDGVSGSAVWHDFTRGWTPVVAIMAALSMVLGNLVAIRQTSLRRLLAYSAIAHAGYMLIAVVAPTTQSLSAQLYYVITYALGTIGTFAIIGVVEKAAGSDHLSSFNGLSRRAPLLSASLFIFLLSLAGIPPLSGFFAKFFVFLAALNATPNFKDLLWLVILAIAMSAVSLYYYLKVLKHVYVTDSTPDAPAITAPPVTQIVIAILAAAVILLGCFPHLLLRWIEQAVN